MHHSRKRIRIVWLVGLLALTLHAGVARAQESTGSEAGWGAGAAVTTLIYGPLKVAYSVLGLTFGGLAWMLSGGNSDVWNAVITPAVRGDYVVTPSHLRGERPLEFIGRDPAYRQVPEVVEEPY